MFLHHPAHGMLSEPILSGVVDFTGQQHLDYGDQEGLGKRVWW